jgi:hypothetical protein
MFSPLRMLRTTATTTATTTMYLVRTRVAVVRPIIGRLLSTTTTTATTTTTTTTAPIQVLVIGDPANPILTELNALPAATAHVVGIFNSVEEVHDKFSDLLDVNTILNVSGDAESIKKFIPLMPSLSWLHTISAGLNHIWCDELLKDSNIKVCKLIDLQLILWNTTTTKKNNNIKVTLYIYTFYNPIKLLLFIRCRIRRIFFVTL